MRKKDKEKKEEEEKEEEEEREEKKKDKLLLRHLGSSCSRHEFLRFFLATRGSVAAAGRPAKKSFWAPARQAAIGRAGRPARARPVARPASATLGERLHQPVQSREELRRELHRC